MSTVSKTRLFFSIGALVLGTITLSPGTAFSQTRPGVANVAELIKTDVKTGTGEEAVIGKMVDVHYTGWLYDPAAADKKGRKFDTSHDRGPFSFLLGAGRVIKGWDRGVVGMKIGGQRTLIIPAAMAYGASGAGNGLIPPNTALIFDVELLGLRQGASH